MIGRATTRVMASLRHRLFAFGHSLALRRAVVGSSTAAVAALAPAALLHAQEMTRAICVVDAATNAPVLYARVRIGDLTLPSADDVIGRSADAWCVLVPVRARGALEVTRIGYVPVRHSAEVWAPEGRALVAVPPGAETAANADARHDTVFVHMAPLAAALPANITVALSRAVAGAGTRNAVTLSTDSARAMGVASTGALAAMLPYTLPRSARGEVTLSLRGARREQVAVTLDGVPLTDPSTGLADLADVPLVALRAVTVSPGSDPLGAGPGAAGGVLALQSGGGTIASVRVAAFGDVATEAAWSYTRHDVQLRIGGAHRTARNDFPFTNTASTTGTSREETRVNNDVSRSNALVQLQTSRAQVTLLASHTQLGLVGPVNVRDNDEDRSTTTRLFVRGTSQIGPTMASASVRTFALGYRDPTRPQFNSDAHAAVAEVDARRTVAGVLLHAGVGADRLRSSSDVVQDRARGFVSMVQARRALGVEWTGGARADAVQGSGVRPSFSLAVVRRRASAEAGIRLAQAVRVPTLYDSYFSSPQRLTVRALRPERVVFDGELHARWSSSDDAFVRVSLEGALVQRVTRDAIVWFPGNFGWSPANVGTESMRGAEGRATVARGPLDISVWGTAYDPELTSGTLRIPTPYVPSVAGGAISRLRHGALQLSAANRWVGARPYTAGPRDPAFMLPAVALLDLSISSRRALGRGDVMLVASLDNATNRAWQSVRGFPAPGRSWSVALTIRP